MSTLAVSLRLAWRDLRQEGRRAIFYALLVAAGVASLVGVQGFAQSVRAYTFTSARELIQGDIRVLTGKQLSAAQQDVADAFIKQGAKVSAVWQGPTVAVAPSAQAQMLVEVKAVEPKEWPYYGQLVSQPDRSVSELIASDGDAIVAQGLLDYLHLKVGDTFKLGRSDFRIAGVIHTEPATVGSGQIPVGPRVIVSLAAIKQAMGGTQYQYLVIKLGDGMKLADAKTRLHSVFPGENDVQTYEDARADLAGLMDQVFAFLTLIALVSLMVGGLGVAMAMRTFVNQKLEHIAIFKSLGMTSGRISLAFLAEAAMLGLGGSVPGALLGLGVQKILPWLLRDLLPADKVGISFAAAGSGLAAGVLTAVICALLPIRNVRRVKPVALFRQETGGRRNWKDRLGTLGTSLLVIAGLLLLVINFTHSAPLSLAFMGVLLLAALLLYVTSWILIRVARLLPQAGHPAARYAIRNLYAKGNQTVGVAMAMGLGIMLITSIYLLQGSLLDQVRQSGVGDGVPNLFIFGVKPQMGHDLRLFLEGHPGVTKVPETRVVVNATIVSIDGKPATELNLPGALTRPFQLTDTGLTPPAKQTVAAGDWFTAADAGKPTLSVMDSQLAKLLGEVKPGSKILFRIKNKEIEFTVKSILNGSPQFSAFVPIAAAPGSLDALADTYLMSAVTKTGQERTVVSGVLDQFPGVVPMGMTDFLNITDTFLSKITALIRFMAAFSTIAAGVILYGTLSATQLRRRKEVALLKTLGASRRTVATAMAFENAIIGAVAGLAGGGLAYLLMKGAALPTKIPLHISPWPLVTACLVGAVLAILVGLSSTLDALKARPMGILRSE